MPNQIVVEKIKKNSRNEVWIVLDVYQGRPVCHIREYFRTDDSPEWRPTKKGVCIPAELVGEAADAAERLANASSIGEAASIPRGKSAKIIFGVCEYNKHNFAEIRTYYRDDENGAWKHGKGATLPLVMVNNLAEALHLAENEFEKNDVLKG